MKKKCILTIDSYKAPLDVFRRGRHESADEEVQNGRHQYHQQHQLRLFNQFIISHPSLTIIIKNNNSNNNNSNSYSPKKSN